MFVTYQLTSPPATHLGESYTGRFTLGRFPAGLRGVARAGTRRAVPATRKAACRTRGRCSDRATLSRATPSLAATCHRTIVTNLIDCPDEISYHLCIVPMNFGGRAYRGQELASFGSLRGRSAQCSHQATRPRQKDLRDYIFTAGFCYFWTL